MVDLNMYYCGSDCFCFRLFAPLWSFPMGPKATHNAGTELPNGANNPQIYFCSDHLALTSIDSCAPAVPCAAA